MQQIKMFCDVCGKEGEKGSGGSSFAGVLARFTADLQKQGYRFAEDYCSECSEIILKFVEEFKRDVDKKNLKQDA